MDSQRNLSFSSICSNLYDTNIGNEAFKNNDWISPLKIPVSSTTSEQFLKSAHPGPLIHSFPLLDDDPFDLYVRLTGISGNSFLLESGKGESNVARYSYIGSDPYLVFSGKGGAYEIRTPDKGIRHTGDPFGFFTELLAHAPRPTQENLPPFLGGAVGFFSYDLVRQFEILPQLAVDDLQLPDLHFLFVEALAAIDHETKMLHLIFSPAPQRLLNESRDNLYREGQHRLGELRTKLETPEGRSQRKSLKALRISIHGQQSQTEYMDRVKACQELIAAGDIYQANLSHRFTIHNLSESHEVPKGHAAHYYQQIRRINPSPFSAFLVLDDCTLVCNSPERLVRLRGRRADIRPIAGTRPRGLDLVEDRRLVESLLANAKEQAEHLMLVDLARNDLGRVSRYGSVTVDQFMTVERYSHVAHLVSNVSGLLNEGVTASDVIRATFPGGTITGVPKVHCMEIIEGLEPVRRGPYTGSIGYVSWTGDMDMNIIIRTLLLTNGQGYLQVGAGIVADSNPRKEYEETVHKAQAFFQALH